MRILLATSLMLIQQSGNINISLDEKKLEIKSTSFNLQSSGNSGDLRLEKDNRTISAKIACDSYWIGDERKDRFRSEFQSTYKHKYETPTEYSFSFIVDSMSDKQALKSGVVVAQFHATEDEGDFSGYPIFELVLTDQGVEIYSSSNREKKRANHYPRVKLLGPYKVDIYSFVSVKIEAEFSYLSKGRIDVKINGEQVLNLKNINIGHNDDVGPYFKFGVYMPKYECRNGFEVKFRDIYLQ